MTAMDQPIVLDAVQILKLVPHRYPMVMIDRVVAVSDNHIVAIKAVSLGESYFPGHFPQMPIMPGVLIIEAMAQAAGLLGNFIKVKFASPLDGRFVSIESAKFRRPVIPGDIMYIEAKLYQIRGDFVICNCEAKVDDKIVAAAKSDHYICISSGNGISNEEACDIKNSWLSIKSTKYLLAQYS